MRHTEARARVIALVEEALAILDERGMAGPPASYLDHALALLRADEQATAVLGRAGFDASP